MSIDIGTGDGRAVLARARAEPGALAMGIDADASRVAKAAARATRKPARGGVANARFLVCAAESLPAELASTADLVTIQFPWGSLLRGIVSGDPAIILAAAGLLKPAPASELHLLLSLEARDRPFGPAPLDVRAVEGITDAFAAVGLEAMGIRQASLADLRASRSTWAKRLRAGSSARRAWLLTFGVRQVAGASEPPSGWRSAGRAPR